MLGRGGRVTQGDNVRGERMRRKRESVLIRRGEGYEFKSDKGWWVWMGKEEMMLSRESIIWIHTYGYNPPSVSIFYKDCALLMFSSFRLLFFSAMHNGELILDPSLSARKGEGCHHFRAGSYSFSWQWHSPKR